MNQPNSDVMQYFHGINPLAEGVMNGYNYPHCPEFVDVAYFPTNSFTDAANVGTLLNQIIQIDMDADFIWRGIVMTNPVDFRFNDSQGYYLSNDFLPLFSMSTDFSNPFPVFPEIIIPRGGKVGVDLSGTSSATTTIITLIGAKRYYTGAAR